ncbi:MAG: hypothetical protein AB7D29_07910 [Campylobacterales bacterium]
MFLRKLVGVCTLLFCIASNIFAAGLGLDRTIVGQWQGLREQNTKCQFLAWNSKFTDDGRFEITFFADKERKIVLHTEKGTWQTKDGQQELTTEGVPTPDVYTYTIIDNNTIRYVNIKSDPSADCQEDYNFTEYRVR